MRTERPICPKTGKRCFESKRAAKQGAKTVHNRFRVYFCRHCRHFHITSLRVPTRGRKKRRT